MSLSNDISNGAIRSPASDGRRSVELFGHALRTIWIVIAVASVISELVPAVEPPQLVYYSYQSGKAVLFFLLGYFTPLAFHRFDRLNRGLLIALGSAAFVEGIQALLGNGHRLNLFELGAKVLLIGLGFIGALDARYERAISFGSWRLELTQGSENKR